MWNGGITRREIIKAIIKSQGTITKKIKKAISEMSLKISELIVAHGEKTRELLRKK